MKKIKDFFKVPEGFLFSNKYLLIFLFPIFLEQALVYSLNIANTIMISLLPDSTTALAGIANVSRIDNLFKQVFVALAAGGGIFVAQYLGAGRKEEANKALKHGVYSLFVIAVALAAIMEIFKVPILNLLFGSVEEQVMQQSLTYYTVTVLSYPFMAIFNAGTASFRSMGKTKATFVATVAMMAINLVLKYIFLFHTTMEGVLGAGLSILIAYAIVGIIMLVMLTSKKNPSYIERPFDVRMSIPMLGKMYAVALPTGIENGLFQFGTLILQTLIATLGTASINANHLTQELNYTLLSFSTAFSLGALPLVSKCMGAKRPEEAEFYVKHLVKIERIILFVLAAIFIPLSPLMVSAFGYDAETSRLAVYCFAIYAGATPFLYPTSYTYVYALRGTGDTKFTMLVSVSTMFLFRIGFAYLLCYVFNLGVLSIWFAMISDWLIRSILFVTRFRHGKWKQHNLIHD